MSERDCPHCNQKSSYTRWVLFNNGWFNDGWYYSEMKCGFLDYGFVEIPVREYEHGYGFWVCDECGECIT
jgi:hypothetical protein